MSPRSGRQKSGIFSAARVRGLTIIADAEPGLKSGLKSFAAFGGCHELRCHDRVALAELLLATSFSTAPAPIATHQTHTALATTRDGARRVEMEGSNGNTSTVTLNDAIGWTGKKRAVR